MKSTIYTVIGMLDEAAPIQIAKGKAEIQWFYQDEIAAADLFEIQIRQLAAEYNLLTEIKRETTSSGLVCFLSEEISALLCSFYVEKGLTNLNSKEVPLYVPGEYYLQAAYGQINQSAFPSNVGSGKQLTGSARRTRLAFLTGAYARYGSANRFRFANAAHKARTVEELLIDLGCTWLQITRNLKTVPSVNEIEFEMTAEMENCFAL